MSKSVSRYAHSDGFMSFFYDTISGKCYTCGADGEVRVFTDIENDFDPISYRIGEQAYAVCVINDKLLVADEAGYIQRLSLPDGSKDGFVTKFNEFVVHMVADSKKERVLAGSRDSVIKLVKINDNSQITFGLTENHTAPVLSVSLDPKEEFFSSSSADGAVKIWRLDDSTKPQKTLQILPKNNDVSAERPLCRLQFSPKSGEFLAVPVGHGVRLYARNTWNLVKTLQDDDEIVDECNVVCFSDCGKFLAVGCLKGRVVVWDLTSKSWIFNRVVSKKGGNICGLSWDPVNRQRLIYCDTKGYLGIVGDIFDKHETAPAVQSDQEASAVKDRFYDDGASMDSDIGAIKSRYNSQIFVDDDEQEDRRHNEVVVIAARPTSSHPPPPSWTPKCIQEPFVVASTARHLSERFMKYNEVGIVRQYDTDTDCSVDVEFHDVSVHHALQFDNTVTKYSYADVSTEAVVLASSSADDAFKSRLYVLHFASWDSSKDWSIDFPEGEAICVKYRTTSSRECLCTGDCFVAVGTRQRNVRLFSITGIQLGSFSVPGPLVTLAARESSLVAAFANGIDFEGNPKLSGVILRRANEFCSRTSSAVNFKLCLSENSSLNWLGFSVEGTVCLQDSKGVVRLYEENSVWIEIFDSRIETKNELDFIWITSVHEYSAQLRGVRCKNSKFPSLLPRPVTTVYEWRLSFCESATEKSSNEEKFASAALRKRHCVRFSDDNNDVELSRIEYESIVKLFLLACNAERDGRALEIAQLAESAATLNVLINLAMKKGRRVLADKISDLLRVRTTIERHRQLDSDSPQPYSESPTTQPPLFDDERRSPSLIIDNPLLSRREIDNRPNIDRHASQAAYNPFKKSGDLEVERKRSIGQSVFDDMAPISNRKRPKSNEFFNSEDPKKPKTLLLKKQMKLSFGGRRESLETEPSCDYSAINVTKSETSTND